MGQERPIDALIRELGPLLAPERIEYFQALETWTIDFDANTRIQLGHDPDHGLCVCELDLGSVPTDGREEVHRRLLRGSHTPAQALAPRAALDEKGHAVLLLSFPLSGMNSTGLHKVLADFASGAAYWRNLLQATSNSGPGSTVRNEPPPGGIRA